MSVQDLRKKLKPVPVSSMEEQDKELNEMMGRKDRDNDHHSVDDGVNLFRIYPPHEPLDPITGKPNPFAEPKVVVFLPAMVIERDKDGKEIKGADGKPKMKLGVKPVYNAKVHGKRDKSGNPVSKDLVEEFIRLTLEKNSTIEDKDAREKANIPIYGVYSTDPSKRVNGINYNQTWECYADKIKNGESKFAMLELKKAVKTRLNKISAIETADDPLGTDPFTDLDEGRAIKIVYNSDAKKAEDYYTTELDGTTETVTLEGGRKANVLKTYPITDEQLEVFAKAESLSKMYRNQFKRRDFDLQLQGLKLVDEKFNIGVFNSEAFQTIAEEIASHYPVEDDSKEESKAEEKEEVVQTTTEAPLVAEKPVPVEVRTDLPFDKDEDMFSSMTREELKEFSKDNQTGIIIKPASVMSDENLRDALRDWYRSATVTTEEVVEKQTTTVQETTTSEETLPVVTLTAKERMELLQKKKAEEGK